MTTTQRIESAPNIDNNSHEVLVPGTPVNNINVAANVSIPPQLPASPTTLRELFSTPSFLQSIDTHDNESTLITKLQKTAGHTVDQAITFSAPIITLFTKLLKLYAGTAYGLGLATQNAELAFGEPVRVELDTHISAQYQNREEHCPAHYADHFTLPNNPGIDLAEPNLTLSIGAFLFAEALEQIVAQTNTQAEARLVSKHLARGVHKAFQHFEKELVEQENLEEGREVRREVGLEAELEEGHNEKSETHHKPKRALDMIQPLKRINQLSWVASIASQGALLVAIQSQALRNGVPLTSYKGLDNMQVLANQVTPFSGNYEQTCDLTHIEPIYNPTLTTLMDGELTIPASFTRGVDAPELTRTLFLVGISGYLASHLTMRASNHPLFESRAYHTTLQFLHQHADQDALDTEPLRMALLSEVRENSPLSRSTLKALKPLIDEGVDELLTQQTSRTHLTNSHASTSVIHNAQTLFNHQFQSIKTLFQSLDTPIQFLDNLSDTLFILSFMMQSATEGIKFISSGFNGIVTSSTTTYQFEDHYHTDEFEPTLPPSFENHSSNDEASGEYQMKVTFPKSRTVGIVSDVTLTLLVISIILKFLTKTLQSYQFRKAVSTSIQHSIQRLTAEPSVQLLDRAALVKHLTAALRHESMTSHIEHNGIKLGKMVMVPGLSQYQPPANRSNPHDASPCFSQSCSSLLESMTRYSPKPIAILADSLGKTALDLIGKVGTFGLCLGFGAKFADEFSKDAAIRFVDDAVVNVTLNNTLTVNGVSISTQFSNSSQFPLEDLIVPNPSEVTVQVTLVGLGIGAVLLPLATLLDILQNEAIIKNELLRALKEVPAQTQEFELTPSV